MMGEGVPPEDAPEPNDDDGAPGNSGEESDARATPPDPLEPPPDAPEPRPADQKPRYPPPAHGERAIDSAEIRGHEEAQPHGGEVDFEPDVEYLHRFLVREYREPEEGRESPPWWLWVIIALTVFWGGWYLGHHGGTFNAAAHLAYSHVQGLVRKEEAQEAATAEADPVKAGQALYLANCQACHQPTGTGAPGVFPPIIGADRVLGPPAGLVLILLHGINGPLTVNGVLYNGAMPAWADVMTDAEIAAVATFIRQWETNQAPPVSPELVGGLRAASSTRTTPWTEPELDAALASPEIQEASQIAASAEPTEPASESQPTPAPASPPAPAQPAAPPPGATP